VPLRPGSFNTGVGNVVEWDAVKSRQLFRDLTLDKPIVKPGKAPKVTIAPSSISLKVLNATNTNGFAAKAANDLARVGFPVHGTGNAPKRSDPAHTVVRYGPSRADSARTVAAAVPGATLKLDPGFGNGIELILGGNYHGTRTVHVVSGSTGTPGAPRTAAQDICS
jgi:hypothetical protein